MSLEPHVEEEKERDPVDYVVIIVTVLICILIIFGYVKTIAPFVNYQPRVTQDSSSGVELTQEPASSPSIPSVISAPKCSQGCVTLSSNGTKQSVTLSDKVTIELPENTYPKENFLLFGNPEGSMVVVGPAGAASGNWAVVLQAVKKGVGDVVVGSNSQAVSDFHVSFSIN